MMNLKYYLRGLGIGIIVTALIMGISMGGKKESLSDAEIRERAKALGMVEENTTLAANVPAKTEDIVSKEETPEPTETAQPKETPELSATEEQEETPEPTETAQPKETPEPTETAQPKETPEPAETAQPKETPEPAETAQPKATPKSEKEQKTEANQEKTGSIIIEVKSGDGSYTVCRRLEDAGLVASASSFDAFLCQNGYDKRIGAGVFEIPIDADPEQIARILNGME